MKTYPLFYLFLVCAIVFSCEKSEEIDNETSNPGADASYTLLVNSASGLDGIPLDATAETITLGTTDSQFSEATSPSLSYKDGTVFSFYRQTGNCNATFLRFDFSDETSKTIELFSDLGSCNLTAYAVAHTATKGYVAYGVEIDASTTEYFVRAFDLNGTATADVDIPLNKKPVHLSFTNERLFVLTIDDQVTDENFLTVLDSQTNSILIEMGLGYDAQKLLRNVDDNVIICYDELHTLLDSETLTTQFIQYQSGKEPQFVTSEVNNFDEEGKMYYERAAEQFSVYPLIPAVYDFSNNLNTLYPYENFLTEAEREFEYEIETTTMVGYDEKNDYLLIGYKKTGATNKGGLLRVRTGTMPAVIDNINVDGIPFNIIVK
ncbi:hypothetical protein FGM00_08875 [Aggregatimonas sangjinii]|uniref:DUF4374 domain-containing protein n=1 Tax=Aggregatimonas sangjinii TaxID=2583587 RepID=A0A5B7SNV6_9FLAO|nr:hypothetical protein [Aggregatimonas sangjinii]QCX00217.1 hypothetical protein FGM00_08875 [Aggregatimonas sangjinii]